MIRPESEGLRPRGADGVGLGMKEEKTSVPAQAAGKATSSLPPSSFSTKTLERWKDAHRNEEAHPPHSVYRLTC